MTLAMYTNTCSLAGTNTSLVTFSIVEKDALVGCLLLVLSTHAVGTFQHLAKFPKSFSHPIIFYPSGCTKFQREDS